MLSIIIPFHNEKDNIEILYKELVGVLNDCKYRYEIIFVDDGSTDQGRSTVEHIKKNNTSVRLIIQRKRFGKGEALSVALQQVKGDTVLFMDGDLQDDPHDIPSLVDKINSGYDFVNGVRYKRQDNILIRLYSQMARSFLHLFLHSPFSDINCGFKIFKKEVLQDIVLYGNNFRFLPLAVYLKGFKVSEIFVKNRPRLHGRSKYGIGKLFFGIIDTITAYFIYRFAERPLHFFGAIGLFLFIPGVIISIFLAIERIFFNMLLYRRPLLQFGILLIIVGIQVMMTGIIGELIVYLDKRRKNR